MRKKKKSRKINKNKKISLSEWLNHEIKQKVVLKFFLLSLIVIIYFVYMSFKFGTKDGFLVTALTWSFFVFCTPVADAGMLIALPVRMLFQVKMIYTQLISFLIAFSLNLYAVFFLSQIYEKTVVLRLFHHILIQPFPFWGIIILSVIGTIFSIYFGDELIDVAKHSQRRRYHKHKMKYKMIVTAFVFMATVVLYNFLLQKLGVNISL